MDKHNSTCPTKPMIYKIWNSDETGSPTNLYIFVGKLLKEKDTFKDYLTSEELKLIHRNKTEVKLIYHLIHGDDTIITIKRKIIQFLKFKISTQEIYLYGIKEIKIKASIIFESLSQFEKNVENVNRAELHQFLNNILQTSMSPTVEIIKDILCKKEEFTQDDFSEFENSIFKNKLQLTFPIGQKLVFKRKYYFTANPFNVNNENININKNINNILTTQNNHLLFECGKLVNNNIYMCLADKVLEYAYKEPNVSEKYMCSLFFPNLAQKSKIFSLHELNDKKHHLYEEQKLSLGKTFIEYNKNIDLFYNMWFSKKKNLIYSKNTQGVESINFTIHPHNIIKFPLEILFKLINSTELVPFIKYNPGNNRGNIYRLYTGNKVSMTGKKIPFLYSFTNSKKD